jgi:hypothetical protein
MARKTKDAPGRVTPKGGTAAARGGGRVTEPSGRYTPPIPHEVHHSGRWVPALMIAFFAVGVLGIVLDYLGAFGTPSNWFLLGGLVCIVAGFVTATRWH